MNENYNYLSKDEFENIYFLCGCFNGNHVRKMCPVAPAGRMCNSSCPFWVSVIEKKETEEKFKVFLTCQSSQMEYNFYLKDDGTYSNEL